MKSLRIFQNHSLEIGNRITLDDRARHYLVHVRRLQLGDSLRLFNGNGCDYEAIIRILKKQVVEVEIMDRIPRETQSRLKLNLAQCIARGEKMDFIIQKAVELGVQQIFPLMSEHGNVHLAEERLEKKLAHWQGVMISATEQCGRTDIPQIHAPLAFNSWISQVKKSYKVMLSPTVKNKLSLNLEKEQEITILIGPEGGLSVKEIELAHHHKFVQWNLGPRVLRTETASLAAISILQHQFGDL